MSVKINKLGVDFLDLKVRVPPLLAQRLFTTSESVHSKTEHVEAVSVNLYERILTKSYLINWMCMFTLIPFIVDILPIAIYKEQAKGCVFLWLSPVTFPCLFFFNIQHKNSKITTIVLAFVSLLLGNLSCIMYCASSTVILHGFDVGLLALSFSLILGTFQLLMLINKKNIAIVMISTATTVVVFGLSIAGLFLQKSGSKRCYQSTIPCIVWLFWQATQNHTYFSNHLQISSSDLAVTVP
jgi:hypothetical protein